MSTITPIILPSSKPCLMPCGFVGQTEKSHLCSSHICTQGPAILAWNLPKFWGKADGVLLLPIYPAREAPIPGVDAQWLFDNISGAHTQLTTSDSIFGDLKARSVDVLVTAGAGDIDRLVPQALQHMKARLE